MIASYTYSCRLEYQSTDATLNEFLNVAITEHLNETYSIHPSISLGDFPIGFKECLTLENSTQKINSVLLPLGVRGSWSAGVFQVLKIDDKKDQQNNKKSFLYESPYFNSSLLELEEVNTTIDSINNRLIIQGSNQDLAIYQDYLKSIESPNQYLLEFEITELIYTNEDKQGIDLAGFINNSIIKVNSVGISPVATISYLSDSLSLNVNVKQNSSYKIIEGKTSTFFTGLQIENIVTTSTQNQLVSETQFRDVGINIETTLKKLDKTLYIELYIKNEELVNNGISKTSLNSVYKVPLGSYYTLVGETRNKRIYETKTYPILNKIPLIGSIFEYKAKTREYKKTLYTIKVTKI